MKTKTTKARAKSGSSASRKKIREFMTPNVVVVGPDDTLQIAARKMRERDIGFLPVCDGQRLIGTLSDRDITVRAVAEGRDPKSTPVREFASPQPVWCFDDQEVGEAAQRMQEKQVASWCCAAKTSTWWAWYRWATWLPMAPGRSQARCWRAHLQLSISLPGEHGRGPAKFWPAPFFISRDHLSARPHRVYEIGKQAIGSRLGAGHHALALGLNDRVVTKHVGAEGRAGG